MPKINLKVKMNQENQMTKCKFQCNSLSDCITIVRRYVDSFYNQSSQMGYSSSSEDQQFTNEQLEDPQGRNQYTFNTRNALPAPQITKVQPENFTKVQALIQQIVEHVEPDREACQYEVQIVSQHMREVFQESAFDVEISKSYVDSRWSEVLQGFGVQPETARLNQNESTNCS